MSLKGRLLVLAPQTLWLLTRDGDTDFSCVAEESGMNNDPLDAMQELEQFANGISVSDDVLSVGATPCFRPSSGFAVEDENHGFEIVQSHISSGDAQGSFGVEHANTGLAISSALSSLPSRPMQHFWENNFWDVMLGDNHGVMDVFSSGMKSPLPVRQDDEDEGNAASDPVKALRSFKTVCHDFMECVLDIAPHTWKEERESLQQISIRRWHSMLINWHDEIQIVQILRGQEGIQQQLQTIVDIFYNKAPSTLMKRARSLARVTNYFNDRGLSFPCTEPQMYTYLCEERDGGAPGSRLKGILEEVVFSRHVLGVIEFDEIIEIIQSRRCSGAASVGGNHVIRQATPLTVKQVS